MKSFADAFDPRLNAFGFLRLLLASLVLFSHSYPLGGFGPDPLEIYSGKLTFGTLSVMLFFAISGFLITRSAEQCPSIFNFAWNRFLRLFPGLWFCLFITAAFFVPIYCLIEDRSIPTFYQENSAAMLLYIKTTGLLEMEVFAIPPLLDNNPHKGAINGSLWSLLYEWRCYLLVGAFVIIRRTRFFAWGVSALALAIVFGPAIHLGRALPWFEDKLMAELSPYFFVAAALYVFRHRIPNSPLLFALCLGLFIVSLKQDRLFQLAPLFLSYSILWLAFNLPKALAWFDRVGDASYGMYIYAFPVQQGLSAAGLHKLDHTRLLILSLFLTLSLGVLSYHLVEKPALKLKKWRFPTLLQKKMNEGANKVSESFL